MWSSSFWRGAAERAIRTFAQTAVALIGADLVSVVDIDYATIGGVSATAALLSVLTSIAAASHGEPGPSFGQETEIEKS